MRAVASAIAIVLALFFSHYRGDTYSRDDTNANYYKNYFKRSHILLLRAAITCDYGHLQLCKRSVFLCSEVLVSHDYDNRNRRDNRRPDECRPPCGADRIKHRAYDIGSCNPEE